MYVIPAIDLLAGKCVRLFQGDYAKDVVYNENPTEQAKLWENHGAEIIHIVDLDAAKSGVGTNRKIVKDIALKVKCKLQVGGGIRNINDVEELLDYGVWRVIIGSAAIDNPKFVGELIERFGPEKIVVGIDARNGYVSGHGWTKDSNLKDTDFVKLICKQYGVKHIIHTDIMKDGTLKGPNFESYERMLDCSQGAYVICSGGVGSISDIKRFLDIAKVRKNAEGIIVGKALYDGRIDLKEAIELSKKALRGEKDAC